LQDLLLSAGVVASVGGNSQMLLLFLKFLEAVKTDQGGKNRVSLIRLYQADFCKRLIMDNATFDLMHQHRHM
jgi:hypothetical protein